MPYNKFEEMLLNTKPEKMIYHFYKHGLFIKSQVTSVDIRENGEWIIINFENGKLDIFTSQYKIIECRQPDMLLTDCEVCFRIKNNYDDCIGFIYVPKEKYDNRID